jgi:hypothetical protein
LRRLFGETKLAKQLRRDFALCFELFPERGRIDVSVVPAVLLERFFPDGALHELAETVVPECDDFARHSGRGEDAAPVQDVHIDTHTAPRGDVLELPRHGRRR